MFRKKGICRPLEKAKVRLDGIQSIDTVLDLGTGLSAKSYGQKIVALQQKISTYNSSLAAIDALRSQIVAAKKDLSDYSEQMLMSIGGRFGKNSYEYEKAGGVRKSERKRPNRRPPSLAQSSVQLLAQSPAQPQRESKQMSASS